MFRPRISAYPDSRPPRYPEKLTASLNELGNVETLMEARKAVKELLKNGEEIRKQRRK